MAEARVGAVAIGRNEGERLIRCLASLAGVPTVYVDSASTDGSVAAARAAGAEVVELDLARPFTAGRARAEGAGRLFARRPDVTLVMFVDGDCEVEASWLPAATAYLAQHPDVVAVCGRRRERFPHASFYNALADEEWDTPVGEADACGGDALMRVDAYRAAGGFDPTIIAGEEPELCTRLRARGGRVMRLDQPMTVHDAAMTRWGQWWTRAVRSGFGYAQAWRATRARRPGALYARELARAIAWAGVLPVTSIALALLVQPALLLLWPALVMLQGLRMSLNAGPRRAALSVAVRYAELGGALRYCWRALRGDAGGTILYK